MSEDLDGHRKRAWRYPGCTFTTTALDSLAGHIRLVHVGVANEQKVPTTWTCPTEACNSKRFESAKDLALHLEAHAIRQATVASKKRGRPKKPKRRCRISGCQSHAIARGLCLEHYQAACRQEQAQKDE